MSNKDILYNLKATNNNMIEAIWAPGHEGIQINEIADQAARDEAKKQINDSRPLERKTVLINLKHQVLTNWQRRVDHELANHQVAEINNTVRSWNIYNIKGSKHLTRLATGHHFLNSFQSKINPKTSRFCSCGETETVHHYLFTCQKYIRYRLRWQHRVVGIVEDIEELDNMSWTTAFGQRTDVSAEKNRQLQESICDYILETERFSCISSQ